VAGLVCVPVAAQREALYLVRHGHCRRAVPWRLSGYGIWSGTDTADAPSRGVSPGTEDTYSPNNSSTQVFDIGFLKVDSDKALETAQKHGGDKVLEKNPDTPVIYVLDWSGTTNELIWHVIYGASRDDAKLRVAVNGTTGDFIRVEK